MAIVNMTQFEKKTQLRGWSKLPYKEVRSKINLFIYDEIRKEGEDTEEPEQDGGAGDVLEKSNPTAP
jgi:hypothetical protein